MAPPPLPAAETAPAETGRVSVGLRLDDSDMSEREEPADWDLPDETLPESDTELAGFSFFQFFVDKCCKATQEPVLCR